MSCGVGRRCSSDPQLLWLWCRLATAAPIRPLAWELSFAMAVALKKKKKKKVKVNLTHFYHKNQSVALIHRGNSPIVTMNTAVAQKRVSNEVPKRKLGLDSEG